MTNSELCHSKVHIARIFNTDWSKYRSLPVIQFIITLFRQFLPGQTVAAHPGRVRGLKSVNNQMETVMMFPS